MAAFDIASYKIGYADGLQAGLLEAGRTQDTRRSARANPAAAQPTRAKPGGHQDLVVDGVTYKVPYGYDTTRIIETWPPRLAVTPAGRALGLPDEFVLKPPGWKPILFPGELPKRTRGG